MRNRHITRFGSILASSGALYFATDQEGLTQMAIDMELEQLRARGRFVTPNIKSEVKSDVQRRKTEYHDKVNQLGVPDKLKNLLLITKKADAERYIKELIITEYDLFLLIHNCSQIRFTHRSKFKQYVPEHLRVSDTDRDEMKTGSPKKMIKKVSSGLLERKYIHVHLFEFSTDWHCFYFTHQDIEPTSANHWRYGCHLHYISHLWTGLKKRLVWSKFNKRSVDISGSLHIKFEPFEYPNHALESSANNMGKLQPWAVIFDSNLANGCGSVPLPVAQMSTRGLWVTQMSLGRKT